LSLRIRPERSRATRRPANNEPVGYDAFISYSHAVDRRLAPALQRALHQLAKPWYRLRALRVFRDDANLSANPHLWASIQDALDSSRFFILLASPESARSPWVQREVQYWCQHKPPANLLIALTDGAVNWDSAANDFHWGQTTALPPSLEGMFDTEPRWVDLSWARTQDHLSLNDPRFRDGVADLAAPLHGQAKDELFGEDVRQHRRTVRLARSAVAILVLLALLASSAAVVAIGQRNLARAQESIADRQARLAISRYLVSEARSRSETQPDLSALLSLTAYSMEKTVEARNNLLEEAFRRRDAQALLAGHNGGITSLAFSPDGHTLASASTDDTIKLWDAIHRTLLATLRGHKEAVTSIAFSPDGHTLASGSSDDTIILWNLTRPVPPVILRRHKGDVLSVAFSPDGRLLASASRDETVILWDFIHRVPLATLRGYKEGATSVTFSPDGRLLASAADDETISLLKVRRRIRIAALPPSGGGGLGATIAFGATGKVLASATTVDLALWDVTKHRLIGRLGDGFGSLEGHPVALSLDGRMLASLIDDKTVALWDINRRTRLRAFTGQTRPIRSLAFSPDGQTIAAGSDDKTIALFDASLNVPDGALTSDHGIGRLVFSRDGHTVISMNYDSIGLWDIDRRSRIGTIVSHNTYSMDLRPDGNMIATGNNFKVTLWDLVKHKSIGTLDPHSSYVVGGVSFSPDGRILAASGRNVTLWDVDKRVRIATLRDHKEGIDSVSFSPNGQLLAASSSRAGYVSLWDVKHRIRLATLSIGLFFEGSNIAFSPDSRTLATGTERQVVLWDVARRIRLATLSYERGGSVDGGTDLMFSPDGRILAAGGGEQGIILWDVAHQIPIGRLNGATTAAFGPDGRTLVLGGNTLIIWNMEESSWFKKLCGIIGRELTIEEWREFLPGRKYKKICT
jgi:WD40 repeat protein